MFDNKTNMTVKKNFGKSKSYINVSVNFEKKSVVGIVISYKADHVLCVTSHS